MTKDQITQRYCALLTKVHQKRQQEGPSGGGLEAELEETMQFIEKVVTDELDRPLSLREGLLEIAKEFGYKEEEDKA